MKGAPGEVSKETPGAKPLFGVPGAGLGRDDLGRPGVEVPLDLGGDGLLVPGDHQVDVARIPSGSSATTTGAIAMIRGAGRPAAALG